VADRDYRSFSYWHESSGDELRPRPSLDGSIDVDIAILGAGYTGLWTAWQLLDREPDLRVAIIESEIAGFGASGRNGGWCYASIALSPVELTARYGRDAALAVAEAMSGAVRETQRVAALEGIDADIASSGALEVARAPWQVDRIRAGLEGWQAIGFGDHVEFLDEAETKRRVNVPTALASMWKHDAIAIHPAKLARGLAQAVERRGATIYEQTRVVDYSGGDTPVLRTDRGDVRARRAIVLAGEAYLTRLEKTRRHAIPLTSNMVITEPLAPAVWEEIGWANRELIGGAGPTGAYIQKTADGRIALGPYWPRYPYNSKITDALDCDDTVLDHARRCVREWFPQVGDVRFTHAWGGVFGMPRDRMPTMGFNPRTKVAMGFGYAGSGVATACLSGQVLADLIAGIPSPRTRLPMATHKPVEWEPEPFRYLGVTAVQRSFLNLQERIEREGRPPKRKVLSQYFYDR